MPRVRRTGSSSVVGDGDGKRVPLVVPRPGEELDGVPVELPGEREEAGVTGGRRVVEDDGHLWHGSKDVVDVVVDVGRRSHCGLLSCDLGHCCALLG